MTASTHARTTPARTHNQLLSMMSEPAWALIAPSLEAVSLPKDYLIAVKDERVDYVYFPESGLGSVTLTVNGGMTAEAGMFGRDGFSPIVAALGGQVSFHDIFMQSAGRGHRIDREALGEVIDADRAFERILVRYAQVFATQVSYTALANAGCRLGVRLARWLLMCHDRIDGDDIHLTHHSMSLLLAVRRATVTVALHELEGRQLIRSGRNHVIIKDRSGLEAFAGAAYGGPEKEYAMLLGSASTPPETKRNGAAGFD